jgi:hypothetical protein
LFKDALDCLFYILHIFDLCVDLICFGVFGVFVAPPPCLILLISIFIQYLPAVVWLKVRYL